MPSINHASVYADNPKLAAEHLAALVGGNVETFHPLPGGYACLFDGSWTGTFLELYPKTHRIGLEAGKVGFFPFPEGARGSGTHFNITVDKTRSELEAICKERGLSCAWRGWASFLDVLVEDDLVIELVCKPG